MQKQPKYEAKLIAGRGELSFFGFTNFGSSQRSKKTLRKELERLKNHTGEKVCLSGGGGSGYAFAILKDARLEPCDWQKDGVGLRAILEDVEGQVGTLKTMNKEKFTPLIDSWQVSTLEET